MATPATTPSWVFDELPPSGARRGGDPSEHAFKHDLDTFVREVVQNANDQRSHGKAPEVHFRFHEISDDALGDFFDKMSWKELSAHLRAAGTTQGGRAVGRFLADLERTKKLLVLTIEDRNTVGLTGDETDESSHFRALCKDTLYSHKQMDAAGGSYGLGKSVLWTFSGVSTVLFNSVLEKDPPSRKSPRLIGRTELPSHKVGARWFSGSGWFGKPVDGRRGRRAESLWHLEAALEARQLLLERAERATGTSIGIVGFRDPSVDEEPTIDALSSRIREATARYFWPAMEDDARGLTLIAGDIRARPEDTVTIRPFVDCFRARASERQTIEQPGDTVARSITIELPPESGASKGTRSELLLVVRAAPEKVRDELLGHVAMFRGPGMVVKYWDRSGIAHGLRPFHAVLACGEARHPGAPTPSDRMIERFLRDAEPPGHDDWHSTPRLKENWKRGYGRAIEQLKDGVTQALRELLLPTPSHGSRGPERLEKRFPIGDRGRRAGEERSFHFSDMHAEFDGERWTFKGAVRPTRRTDHRWEAVVTLKEIGDGGAPLASIPIQTLEVIAGAARIDVEGGVARVQAESGTDHVAFRGESTPITEAAGAVGELVMEVGGKLWMESTA